MAARVISGVGHSAKSAGSVFGRGGSTATGTGAAASGFASGFASRFKGNSYVRDAVVDGGTRMGMGGGVGLCRARFWRCCCQKRCDAYGRIHLLRSSASRRSSRHHCRRYRPTAALATTCLSLRAIHSREPRSAADTSARRRPAQTARSAVWRCSIRRSLKNPPLRTPL